MARHEASVSQYHASPPPAYDCAHPFPLPLFFDHGDATNNIPPPHPRPPPLRLRLPPYPPTSHPLPPLHTSPAPSRRAYSPSARPLSRRGARVQRGEDGSSFARSQNPRGPTSPIRPSSAARARRVVVGGEELERIQMLVQRPTLHGRCVRAGGERARPAVQVQAKTTRRQARRSGGEREYGDECTVSHVGWS